MTRSGRDAGRERGKYLYRIARHASRSEPRELAVLETMDGGKPIRESRDVDMPLAAAHFFYYAGWADKLEYAFPGKTPRPLGVAGQIIPWNFPLLMAAWKIAPALATGNTVVLKPAETTPLTALKLAEIIAGRRSARRASSTSSPAPAKPARRSSIIPTSTRSPSPARPKSARSSQKRSPASKKKFTLELGGKAANIIFEDAPIDQAVEGIINGIFFNQGHVCCAGSRLFVQESVADTRHPQAAGPHADAARRRSARQEHRHRRDQLARCSSTRSTSTSQIGEDEGAECGAPSCDVAGEAATGLPADAVHWLLAVAPRSRRKKSSGRCVAVHDVPHGGGGDREREQHALRTLAAACGRTRASRFSR